jgi:hypothetical protein
MNPPVSTKDPAAVEVEVQAAFLAMFPEGNRLLVPRLFGWAIDCFTGYYSDYQAVDAHYHDFEHTLQGTLCLARLLRGRHFAGDQPRLTEEMFELVVLGILLHDTGYLKKRDDVEGTGAKYTITHVARSVEFAGHILQEKGYRAELIRSVQNMIRCTGLGSELASIAFQGELERVLGLALATADLLGQMAADDYVDKLPALYAEFVEAAQFSRNQQHFVASFGSADELMAKSPSFWNDYVRVKLNGDFLGLYRFLNDPYPDGPNWYLERISANIERLKAASQLQK